MNIGALKTTASYDMAGYSVADRKINVYKFQKDEILQNEKVKEDFWEKVYDDTKTSYRSEQIINQKMNGENPGDWYLLADENGIVSYNGVNFVLDNQQLCLGNMDETDNVLSIPLSGGRTLKVNRNNIDDLGKAIGMFSPEDINRILRAISEDTHCRRKLNEIEDDKNHPGKENVSEEDAQKAADTSKNDKDFHNSDNFKRVWNEYFKGVDDSVAKIWKETMEETGTDGFGYNRRGMLTHITQFQIAQITMDRRGQSVLGTTVQSALDFAESALYSLQNPIMPFWAHPKAAQAGIMEEQRFYERLVEKLRRISDEDSDEEYTPGVDKEESKTESDVVVKPDGSRVLMVTMDMGGMESTMSLELSKPTNQPDDVRTESVQQDDMMLSDNYDM